MRTTVVSAGGLSRAFTRLREKGKVAMIPYITAGDPDMTTTAEALRILDSCGADIIELGVPYSDPLADGPVIQEASMRALRRGTNLNAIISMLEEVIPDLCCAVSLFSYYNPVLSCGIESFMHAISDAGIQGLVVPDVPLEESMGLREESTKHGIELVLLAAPTTPPDRMKAIAEASEGFVYLVSSTGVTGARAELSSRIPRLLTEMRKVTSKPVAVGFGISTPDHVKQVAGWGADGVIIGSAMVKLLGEAATPDEGLKALRAFTRSLSSGGNLIKI